MVLLQDDPHDRELLAQVAPPDWTNPEARPRYDLVVLALDHDNEVLVLESERLFESSPPEFRSAVQGKRVVLVPIKSKGKPIGIMLAESTFGKSLSRNQREFLLTLASERQFSFTPVAGQPRLIVH